MKKIFSTTLTLLIFFSSLQFANAQAFESGRNYVSAGYGFGNLGVAIFKTYQVYGGYSAHSFGPLFVKYERGVSDHVGVGLNFADVSSGASWNDGGSPAYIYSLDYSSISVLGRVNFHFGYSDAFDPYFGFGLGYRSSNWNYTSNDPSDPTQGVVFPSFPLGFEMTLGARYMFTDFLGAFAELGIAKGVVQAGLVGKF